MPLRCILVPTGPGGEFRPRLEAAQSLCRRLEAHIELLFISPDPAELLAMLPEVAIAGGLTIENLDKEYKEAAKKARADLEAWCAAREMPTHPLTEHRLDSTYASFTQQTGSIEMVLSQAGRVKDLIVVDRPDWGQPAAALNFDTAVFATGRPTLIVPPGRLPQDLLRKVVIAWNGSLEGARAVGQSIALLHAADEVVIYSAASSTEPEHAAPGLADYLRWHGINVQILPSVVDPPSVGADLLASASAADATMILMGAYTHSRLRELFLGGVTRHVLQHATIPVLMTH